MTEKVKAPTEPVTCLIVGGEAPLLESQDLVRTTDSPHSVGSEPDIAAFAEDIVQQMEHNQIITNEETSTFPLSSPREPQEPTRATLGTQSDQLQRSSTPIHIREEDPTNAGLSAIEYALRVAIKTGSEMPELLSTSNLAQETSVATFPQTDNDNASSVYEVPALPGKESKVRFLTGLSEGKKTVEEASVASYPAL